MYRRKCTLARGEALSPAEELCCCWKEQKYWETSKSIGYTLTYTTTGNNAKYNSPTISYFGHQMAEWQIMR